MKWRSGLIWLLTLAGMLAVMLIARGDTSVQWTDYAPIKSGESELYTLEKGVVRLNINEADESTLTLLDGIGETLAARIVDYREAHGGFDSVEDLMNVKGIGEKKLDAIRALIVCE